MPLDLTWSCMTSRLSADHTMRLLRIPGDLRHQCQPTNYTQVLDVSSKRLCHWPMLHVTQVFKTIAKDFVINKCSRIPHLDMLHYLLYIHTLGCFWWGENERRPATLQRSWSTAGKVGNKVKINQEG